MARFLCSRLHTYNININSIFEERRKLSSNQSKLRDHQKKQKNTTKIGGTKICIRKATSVGESAPSCEVSTGDDGAGIRIPTKSVFCQARRWNVWVDEKSVISTNNIPSGNTPHRFAKSLRCEAILLTESPKKQKNTLFAVAVTRGKFAPSYKASAAEATEQCFDLPSRGAKLSGAV